MFIEGFEKICSVAHEVATIMRGAGKAGNKEMAKDLTKKFVAGPKAPLSSLGKTTVLGGSKLPKPASTQAQLASMPDKMKARTAKKIAPETPPAAPVAAAKPEEKAKGFMSGISKSHVAAGAGGLAVGHLLTRDNSQQQQR